MINGNANEFLDCVYDLHELIHVYHGKKYFLQGYGGLKNAPYTIEVQLWEPEVKTIWSYTSPDRLKCREMYLKAPIYDGKTFWEVEHEIEWVDY